MLSKEEELALLSRMRSGHAFDSRNKNFQYGGFFC